MKELALTIAKRELNKRDAINRLREYLQHLLLRELFEQNKMEELVFHGGTALRILYNLRRFSEDIDFHLKTRNFDFHIESIVETLIKNLEYQNYQVSYKNQVTGAVHSSMIKFEGILNEANLSPHPKEKLSVRFEVDTNPPKGFSTNFTLVNEYFPFGVIHHDQNSFIAGKLHAILQRSYTKGRDFYDIWFFLSRWKDVQPNLKYLNNALEQTGYGGKEITEKNWVNVTYECIDSTDWDQVVKDVGPFILQEQDLKLFKKEILLDLLNRLRG